MSISYVVMVVGSAIWLICMTVACLMSVFADKYNIKEKYVMFAWEIVRYLTPALAGYLFGSFTGSS